MAHLNGVPATAEQLQALALVNYGHFTSIRVDDHRARGITHHLDRLVTDCRRVFDAQLDRERVREFICAAIADKGSESFVVRITVFDPALELGRPSGPSTPGILVTTRPASPLPLGPLRVQSATYQRELPLVKHVGLFGALCHRRYAQLNGFDDALFVDASSFVSEGATWNIGFFDGDQVIWPTAPILPGVTMRLLDQAHDRTTTQPVTLSDVPRMVAAFATNTTIGIRPIITIDDDQLRTDHPIIDILRKEYEDVPPERF